MESLETSSRTFSYVRFCHLQNFQSKDRRILPAEYADPTIPRSMLYNVMRITFVTYAVHIQDGIIR